MEKDDKFQMYFADIARNVPGEVLKYLINLFMLEASANMRNDFDERDLERVIYFITSEYSHLPISSIASAFVRGSLGKFGPGRLIPRVVYGWLAEASSEYENMAHHQEVQEQLRNGSPMINLAKFAPGKAILQKIEWYRHGAIDGDLWDLIDLMKLAEDIQNGKVIRLENYI